MFFNDPGQIPVIAARTGTSIFVVPDSTEVNIRNAIVLEPTIKTVISIDQVRAALSHTNTKQTSEQFILIRPADKLSEDACNALLKTLEEPGQKTHFILITKAPALLLPTILSRAHLYILNTGGTDFTNIKAGDKIKAIAKKLLAAKPAELPALAEEIAKKKDRAYALEIVGITIEILYKSYFLTQKSVFLAKLPRFLALYDHLARNGHIKLHLVADLI